MRAMTEHEKSLARRPRRTGAQHETNRTQHQASACATGVAIVGFVVGALALYIIWVRSGPPWSSGTREKLTAEFTEKKAGEVQSFDDYRRWRTSCLPVGREDLRERRAGPRSACPLQRRQRRRPARSKPDWNRSFELDAEARSAACCLLHGMSDSPYSLRALGETLNQTRLLGARPAPARPWHRALGAQAHHLGGHGGRGAARDEAPRRKVGQSRSTSSAIRPGRRWRSNFALDALDGSASPRRQLVLVSPAIGITPAARWQSGRNAGCGARLGEACLDSILPEFDPYKYNSFATNAGLQVHRLTRAVAAAVEAKANPRLLRISHQRSYSCLPSMPPSPSTR